MVSRSGTNLFVFAVDDVEDFLFKILQTRFKFMWEKTKVIS